MTASRPFALRHGTVSANGLAIAYAECGEGPPVLLCHGWPERWFSWRHQLAALAAAGYRAIAPDMRGYGDTGAPAAIEDYTILHLVGDQIGLADALGLGRFAIVGHDWGAPVAWTTALLRPDRVAAVAGLSVPYAPRGSTGLLENIRRAGPDGYYMLYFQAPGVAEAEFEHDVETVLRRLYHTASGDVPKEKSWRAVVPKGGGLMDTLHEPPAWPPPWMPADIFERYVEGFRRTGFRGAFNWYRCLDRNYALTAPWTGARIAPPALFMAGARDAFLKAPGIRAVVDNLDKFFVDLRAKTIVAGAGHWLQQEAPAPVNAALTAFLADAWPAPPR
jgi:pimeloyl-ACP methyl ester carboxylesterase